MTQEELYDVVAVNLYTYRVRILASRKILPDAEAVVKMAVMRRGCDEEIFAEVPVGKYSEGDLWKGHDEP